MEKCPICREQHDPRGLVYDGRGVNSCGMYRARIATIPDEYHHLGPVLAAAPKLLEALAQVLEIIDTGDYIGDAHYGTEINQWRSLIRAAKGEI